ncbi:MAG: gamma carbonic anhydrase family protein [Alphaproteobacteria bacterium]|nr:MAG: gamma carbonic anhydrase family protein [Alphaproteobacteria bacterium]
MALILPWQGVLPTIAPTAWVAPNATITGDVVLGAEASVWFNVVIRGDVHEIRVGARTNIQDNTVVHATKNRHGTYIGQDVTIGHSAVLHACILEDASFVGMGAIVLDEAVVEHHGMLAAGALLTSGKRVKSGELWAGNPARKLRDLTAAEIQAIDNSALRYVEYAAGYKVPSA